TDEHERRFQISLDFLTAGEKYKATIYADADDAHWDTNPTAYKIQEIEVDAKSTLLLNLAPGGGAAVSFTLIEKK
nr:glycoside hydrolase family 97 C-terminal domain-containing protein [Prolixibacteraceae bacterium]